MKLRKIPDSVDKYIYEPLDLTKRQIRLLTIRPSTSPDDPVQCDIQVFDMHDAPPYVTLSYVWGEAISVRYIILNGGWLRIGANLFNFLLCLRDDPSNVHYVWIDQLCIAQTLELERNHQVRLMSSIYERCLHVIMWLGAQSYAGAVRFDKNPSISTAYEVFHNPYFTRLWVVQEILLARRINLLCGRLYTLDDDGDVQYTTGIIDGTIEQPNEGIMDQNSDMSGMEIFIQKVWLEVYELVSVMRRGNRSEIHEYTVFYDSVFGNSDILHNLKPWNLESWKRLPLAECLTRFSKYECSNRRDKVYGLLGLVLEDQRPLVDYSKSEEEVIADVIMIMSKLHWKGNSGQGTIPNTKVLTQYWIDVLCLTGLAKDMELERHCHPISYLLQEVYDTIAKSKADKKADFPIQAIGYEPNGKSGSWWFKSEYNKTEGQRLFLLACPKFPAWKSMGLDVLPSGVPERFRPYPRFHIDGTPWVRSEQQRDGTPELQKCLSDHEMLSRLLTGKTPEISSRPIRLPSLSTLTAISSGLELKALMEPPLSYALKNTENSISSRLNAPELQFS
ncbi:hypothetical protein E8E13_002682 [Curvularia kusanoi]|uniref:Heterokaryon incompatibility domain-containing protein n=1 Tax=Curvularia kusanoi TaxID=90978 RepID=A0A9P4T5V9_CURKU|nr:hypothetical protein E8E13_002682 [Curvularia kusanoi]